MRHVARVRVNVVVGAGARVSVNAIYVHMYRYARIALGRDEALRVSRRGHGANP